MLVLLSILVLGFLKLLLVAFGILYAGLILMAYVTVGPHYALKVDLGDPARTAESFLVWLGVKAVALILRAGGAVLGTLSEASAEVGEWVISRRGVEAQARFRSRFL